MAMRRHRQNYVIDVRMTQILPEPIESSKGDYAELDVVTRMDICLELRQQRTHR
jgi:hypothetical protein